MKSQYRIGVVGLGYVGLPLAVAFSKNYDVVGFDINPSRISELRDGIDLTLEVESEEIKNNNQLSFTSEKEDLQECNFIIVTVPTPVTADKQPDLSPLISASKNDWRNS